MHICVSAHGLDPQPALTTLVSPSPKTDAEVVEIARGAEPLAIRSIRRFELSPYLPALSIDPQVAVNQVKDRYLSCARCHLAESRNYIVFTRGNLYSPVLAIGEGPGREEDKKGVPFIGRSGRLQNEIFREAGLDPDRDIAWLNVVGCLVGDTLVSAPSIQKGYRRKYTGELVEVLTRGASVGPDASGRRKLTGTPNHPVLTARGWVPLGELTESDDLICGTLREGVGARDPHVENRPARFDELLRALAEFGVAERVVGTHRDFHGDGVNSDVEVVTAQDGLLGFRRQTPTSKHLGKVILENTDHASGRLLSSSPQDAELLLEFGPHRLPAQRRVRRLRELFATLGAGAFKAYLHSFRPGSERRTVVSEIGSELGLADPEIARDRLETFSFGVSPRCGVDVGCGEVPLSPRQRDGLDLSAESAALDQRTAQSLSPDVKLVSERLKTLSSHVATDRVFKIRRFVGSTHVYNLQTSEGWYTANGVVVSNCRPCLDRWSGDRPPSEVEKLACSERLLLLLHALRPRVVICLGQVATTAFFSEPPPLYRWIGPVASTMAPEDWVIFAHAPHPAGLLRSLASPFTYAKFVSAQIFYRELKAKLPTLQKVARWPFGVTYVQKFMDEGKPVLGKATAK